MRCRTTNYRHRWYSRFRAHSTPGKRQLPFPSSRSPWQSLFYSVSMSLATLDTSCKWDPAVSVLWPPQFDLLQVLQVHPCCRMCWDFLFIFCFFSKGWMVSCSMYGPHFLSPFIHRHWCCFCVLAALSKQGTREHRPLFQIQISVLLDTGSEVGLLGHIW